MGAPVAAAVAASKIHMDVEPGETVSFDGLGVEVQYVAKSGRCARLVVTTRRDVVVSRGDGAARSKHAMIPSTERG